MCALKRWEIGLEDYELLYSNFHDIKRNKKKQRLMEYDRIGTRYHRQKVQSLAKLPPIPNNLIS